MNLVTRIERLTVQFAEAVGWLATVDKSVVDAYLNGEINGNAKSENRTDLEKLNHTVTHSIHQLHHVSNPHAAELANLVEKLREAIETDSQTQPTLREADKTEALTQVQILAEAGKIPTNSVNRTYTPNTVESVANKRGHNPTCVLTLLQC